MVAALVSPVPPWTELAAVIACAAAALLLTYAQPYTYSVNIGTANDRASVLAFNARETSPAGVPFRWTTAQSTVVFHAAGLAFPANRRLAFRALLVGSRPAGVAEPAVSVAVGDARAGGQQVGPAAEYRWTLPPLPSSLTTVPVTISSDVFSPVGDRRELGVAVLGRAALVEQSGSGIALPPLGAWLGWFTLVGLAWLLARARFRAAGLAFAFALAFLAASTAAILVARALFWEYMHLALLGAGVLVLAAHWRAVTRFACRVCGDTRFQQPLVVASGFVLLLGGQLQLALNLAPVLGAILLLAGASMLVMASSAGSVGHGGERLREHGVTRYAPTTWVVRWELALLTGVVAIAALARFYRLADIPYGLWRDEARHGLEALRILRDPTYRPVYIPNISLPGLFPLGIALDFRLFGASVPSLRGFTAAFGVASTLLLYALGRRLYGVPAGLLAALLYAVGSWRVSIDRLAFDTAPTTFFTLAGFYAFVRATDEVRAGRRAVGWFGLMGLALALAIYGYYPGRFGPVVVTIALGFLYWRHGWQAARRALPGLLVATAVAVVLLTPLAWFALAYPDAFFRRSGQVFLLAPRFLQGKSALEAIEQNLASHAVMFNWRGEPNARHHAPGWPTLDVVSAAFFVVGLLVAAAGAARGRFRDAFVLTWLGVMLGPSIVSVDAPSAVRAQDAAPAAYLLAGIGLRVAWQAGQCHLEGQVRSLARAAATVLLALAVGLNGWLYFIYMPRDPRVLSKFYVAETRAGYAIVARQELDPRTVVYLPRPYLADEVLTFVAGEATRLPLETGAVLPGGPVAIVVPRGERYAEQLAVAREVAARSGLQELPTPGDIPNQWYAEFARP